MRTVGKKAAIAAGAQVVKKSFLDKSFLFLGTIIKDINPFEYIGDLAAKKLIDSTLSDQLVQIAYQSSENIYRIVQIDLENNLLIPLEEKMAISIESLQNCQIERKSASVDIEQQRMQITTDCENLIILMEEV